MPTRFLSDAEVARLESFPEAIDARELITTSELEHISPLAHQHIHLYGHYLFDLATRPDGHRPLKTPASAPAASTTAPETLNRV